MTLLLLKAVAFGLYVYLGTFCFMVWYQRRVCR